MSVLVSANAAGQKPSARSRFARALIADIAAVWILGAACAIIGQFSHLGADEILITVLGVTGLLAMLWGGRATKLRPRR